MGYNYEAFRNATVKVEGDTLTISCDLTKRFGLTGGSENRIAEAKAAPGKKKKMPRANIAIATVWPQYMPNDVPPQHRKLMYAFSVWEPRKKEPQDETVDLIKKLLKRKDLTLPEQRIAGAILECLQSYPRLLLEMAMADELNEEGQ